ncbi:MAG: class I SAM-dependent methyltransferase [Candidatus Promineifilaceae bacterium]|nr:class I SAM-dependent methyltransferase [Candidatus Promineifilaceae bacterium]
MTQFHETEWADANNTQEYRENADHYIPDREQLYKVLTSYYRHFGRPGQSKRLLDLGCGDGVIAHQLLKLDHTLEVTLLDGSPDMLNSARSRLAEFSKLHFIQATFEDLLAGKIKLPHFDFVASAFAIHHLYMAEKAALFRQIHACLHEGGHFINIDTVLPVSPAYTDWYYDHWRETIRDRRIKLNLEENFEHVPQEARTKPENKLDSLAAQLDALKAAGFKDAACHYKHGLFTVYGGQKQR